MKSMLNEFKEFRIRICFAHGNESKHKFINGQSTRTPEFKQNSKMRLEDNLLKQTMSEGVKIMHAFN